MYNLFGYGQAAFVLIYLQSVQRKFAQFDSAEVLYSGQKVFSGQALYKPKVPKLCTYSILFLLSVFNGTVPRVLIRFCSYKLEFYHELFSDSQKARIKFISKCPPNFNRPHFHLVMERAQV
jgi:hypothetical protein